MTEGYGRGRDVLRARTEEAVAGRAHAVVSLVGGGGKTTALFFLASRFAEAGRTVLVTTTTHIFDPGLGAGPGNGEGEGADAGAGGGSGESASPGKRPGKGAGVGFGTVIRERDPLSAEAIARIGAAGSRVVLGLDTDRDGKLAGLDPGVVNRLAESFDIVLVEADGSRGRPVKAPAGHEPAIPTSSAVVIGVIGLDALGAVMDERSVHRPEVFGPLVGCAPGGRISAGDLARLVASPFGLFKGCPPAARRIVLLNKEDLVSPGAARAAAAAMEAAGVGAQVVVAALEPAGG